MVRRVDNVDGTRTKGRTRHPIRVMTTVEEIREQAIQLVATAIKDEEIPPAKRAELALNLLSKQAIKDTPVPTNEVTTITITQVDADGETERVVAHYTVDTHQSEQPITADYGQP